MAGSVTEEKPHAVLVPYPAQGHITPMLMLAKLLHSRGVHITFVNTDYNHRRLLQSQGPDSVKGLDGFRFVSIPDGLPPSDVDDATQDVPALCQSTSKNCLAPLRDLLTKLSPPATCIVSDGCMSFTLEAAEEFGIPNVLFWTTSACGFMAYLHYRDLVQRGLVPLKDAADLTNGYLDTPIDFIPEMNSMRLRDFPSFIRTTDPDDYMVWFQIQGASRASRGAAIILNTFHDLERPVLEGMAKLGLPPVYTVGPLDLLASKLPTTSPIASMGSSMWKEDTSCIGWLDGREPGSVVYVNFGSIAVISNEQMVELAWGLANSDCDFLWVIRPDLVNGDHAALPLDFLDRVQGRGLLAGWCDQRAVLAHPSVGGMLTHCGWNTTLEAISRGVPMICWPFFAEQPTNCRYVCTEWGIGTEIGGDMRRNEVEALVRELMEGEEGMEMRRRAARLKESAKLASEPSGSSVVNFEKLVLEVLLAIHTDE